jgi:hypothetical protein
MCGILTRPPDKTATVNIAEVSVPVRVPILFVQPLQCTEEIHTVDMTFNPPTASAAYFSAGKILKCSCNDPIHKVLNYAVIVEG